MQAARVELLHGMPIFVALRVDSLEYLLAEAPIVERAAGNFFFREHDQALAMDVLEAGRVTVFKPWQGREVALQQLGPGDCFGEMALMDLMPRSASVRAITACRAIELATANLHRLFERDAEQFALIQMNMGREVCRRPRVADERLFHARVGGDGG